MKKSEMRFINLSDFKKKLLSLAYNIPQFLGKSLTKIAGMLLAKVKKNTPVLSGNLRRKWSLGEIFSNYKESSIEIVNNAEYAEVVEYGKRKGSKGYFAGRFMLKRGMDEMEKQIPTILDKDLQKFSDKELK